MQVSLSTRYPIDCLAHAKAQVLPNAQDSEDVARTPTALVAARSCCRSPASQDALSPGKGSKMPHAGQQKLPS